VWAVKVYFATILLGFVIGGPELGWFTSAHRVVIALHAFVWLYFYNMLPSIARTSQQPITTLQKLMRVSIQITAWAGLLLGIYGSAYAEVGITFIFGVQFQEAGRVFQVLVWLIPLALMSGHFRYTLIGYNRQKLEFYSALVGAAVTVVLNLILVPRLGMMGAAWALVISEAIIWLVAYYFVRRTIAVIPVFRNIWRPIVAGTLVSIILYILIPVNLWIASCIATVVYAALFIIFQPNLIQNLRSMNIQD
jgi:O-antigen/teichoic acid export membrane protein